MTVEEIFEKQIKTSKKITKDVLEKMSYKRTSFNNLYEVGDKMLVAWVLVDTDDLDERKLIHFTDKEAQSFFKNKQLIGMDNFDNLPVFKISNNDI